MPFFFGAMPDLWKVLVVVFVVIPVVRWAIWPGRPPRIPRRHAALVELDLGGGDRRLRRRDFEELKSELDGRLPESDQLHARVAELENRLDFTERLLAQRQESALPGPSTR